MTNDYNHPLEKCACNHDQHRYYAQNADGYFIFYWAECMTDGCECEQWEPDNLEWLKARDAWRQREPDELAPVPPRAWTREENFN